MVIPTLQKQEVQKHLPHHPKLQLPQKNAFQFQQFITKKWISLKRKTMFISKLKVQLKTLKKPNSISPAAEEDPFIYGKETPADADYKFEVAIENNKFTAELKITGINFVGGEKYQVYTGSKGFYQALDEVTASETVLQDAEYKFYFRNDQEAGNAPKLVVDNLGPVRIEKVSIEKNVYDHTGIFAKIGGANKENLTQDQLDAFNSYVNFQKLPNTNTRVRKEGSQTEGNPYYFYKVEGNEVFIYINIDFMVAANATSGKYNTHLNIKENKQENCVSTVQIDGDPVTAREDGATIAVYSHPGVHNEDNIWGNVGFVVEIPEAEAGE